MNLQYLFIDYCSLAAPFNERNLPPWPHLLFSSNEPGNRRNNPVASKTWSRRERDQVRKDAKENLGGSCAREDPRHFCRELSFTEWAPVDAPADEASDQVSPDDIAPALHPLLATPQVQPGDDDHNAPKGPEIPQQRRI